MVALFRFDFQLWKDTSKGGNIEKLHAVGQTENAEQLFLGSHNVGVFSLAEHTGIIAGTLPRVQTPARTEMLEDGQPWQRRCSIGK
jgi:hypothetical protein